MDKLDGLDAGLASQVQQLLLPKSPPLCDWSCIDVQNIMADGLGGDFFDFLPTADGCQAVMIGDVTGHGLSASVVMGLLYGYIHSVVETICSPYAVASRVNDFLKSFAARSQSYDHLFSATLFFGIVEPRTLEMHYINAGHPAPLVRRDGRLISLKATAPPIGFFDIPESSVKSIQFQKNDRWLLYTDGITETMGAEGYLFGKERLERLLLSHNGDHLEFLDHLIGAVRTFSIDDSVRDDCTAIAIDFHRNPQGVDSEKKEYGYSTGSDNSVAKQYKESSS
ncbi:MAG: PP2C family protein-serine/threonine phosphatase [Desulfuromonadales bacterium]|nr:PP2C family protein-serine/threonine phosphatase [Desulfuromonadales bacterium]